jgi:hypothetical protein
MRWSSLRTMISLIAERMDRQSTGLPVQWTFGLYAGHAAMVTRPARGFGYRRRPETDHVGESEASTFNLARQTSQRKW